MSCALGFLCSNRYRWISYYYFVRSFVHSCLLVIRYKCPSEFFLGSMSDIDDNASIFSMASIRVRKELSLGRILIMLNVFPFASGLCFAYITHDAARYSLMGLFSLLTLAVTIYIALYCPEITSNRFVLDRDGYGIGKRRFRTPLVPFLPALGIYMNWFMIANVGWKGMVMLIGYLIIGVTLYGSFCSGKSILNTNYHNDRESQNILPGRSSPPTENSALQQALLEDEDLDHTTQTSNRHNGDLKGDLSEIEQTRKSAFV